MHRTDRARGASRLALATLAPLALVACRSLPSGDAAAHGDPSRAAVPLEAAADEWDASLVLDNATTGIWTVEAHPVFEQYGSPEIVGLDDAGNCHVLVGYSGKWTPLTRCGDGAWLGGLCHGDVDPRTPGAELYVGGRKGNLFQLRAHPHGALDCRLIAHFPGLELHTLVQGDLDPRSPGAELLAFTRPGRLYRLTPTGADGEFEVELLQTLPGRVRDAVVLPPRDGAPREIATVTRAGTLSVLTIDADGTHWVVVHRAPMGLGRLALRAPEDGGPTVLYATHDDGRVLRLERASGGGAWRVETIFLGEQGPRGLAVGRFHADPEVESVALFGYDAQVRLLARRGDGAWTAETLFVDRDKGHWLSAAELDGRNATDELIGSGYGGRIFLLARPPGYGVDAAVAE